MLRSTLLLPAIMACTSLFAQQSTNAAGGEATGTNGTVSYTVGQVDYINFSNSEVSISLGVQQPYILIADEGEFQILVYPNPTPSKIKIKILKPGTDDMQVTMYTVLGQELLTRDLNEGETTISLSPFSPATYILQLRIGETIRTYKIIKTMNQ
jgi:hypothetical protein